jgi:3-hydroxyisobutyrate dehydrogenase
MGTIGFIGLGKMGGPMAANLVKAGHVVKGFDLSPDCRQAALDLGVAVVASAREAVAQADTVITMLPAGHHVVAVWTDLLDLVERGTLLIDSSTIDVASARKVHALFADKRGATLDAPVSGGTIGAAAGTLTFMVGGADGAFERAQPILAAMGKRIVHCGDAGAGQAAKICNNMITGITMAAVSEAFVLAERLGLSHQALYEVASTSSGQCWSLTTYCPVPGPVPASPANKDYKPGFSAALMLKDLRLSQEAALASGASTPMGATAAQLYGLFEKLGHGGDDFSAIIHLLRGGTAPVQG